MLTAPLLQYRLASFPMLKRGLSMAAELHFFMSLRILVKFIIDFKWQR